MIQAAHQYFQVELRWSQIRLRSGLPHISTQLDVVGYHTLGESDRP